MVAAAEAALMNSASPGSAVAEGSRHSDRRAHWPGLFDTADRHGRRRRDRRGDGADRDDRRAVGGRGGYGALTGRTVTTSVM